MARRIRRDLRRARRPREDADLHHRPLAKSNPKYWEGRSDLGKPDWDNVGKLACDSLNGIAFKDDSQVDTGAVTKRPRSPYGTQPRIDIYIEYFVEEYVKEKK